MKNNASFHSFQSTDPNLFAAYVDLRRRVFNLHHDDLPAEFGMPDETDRISRIVYVFQETNFAGAARVTISTPEQSRELPLEARGLRLRDCHALQSLNLHNQPYAEISRMAIDPAFSHDLDASLALAAGLCRVAAEQGVDTIFSICPAGAARLNRRNAKALGVRFEQHSRIATAYARDMWLCAFTGIISVGQNPPSCSPFAPHRSASPATAGVWCGTSAA